MTNTLKVISSWMSSFSSDVFPRYFVHVRFACTGLRRLLYPVPQQRDRCTFASASQALRRARRFTCSPQSRMSRDVISSWSGNIVKSMLPTRRVNERASEHARAFTAELFRRKFGTSGLFWTRRCDFRWYIPFIAHARRARMHARWRA